MKKLTAKIKAILSGNSGETLVESLISILVFAILIETVTLMIMTALRMNGTSISNATASQTSINENIVKDFSGLTGTLTLNSTDGSIDVKIVLPADDGDEA